MKEEDDFLLKQVNNDWDRLSFETIPLKTEGPRNRHGLVQELQQEID